MTDTHLRSQLSLMLEQASADVSPRAVPHFALSPLFAIPGHRPGIAARVSTFAYIRMRYSTIPPAYVQRA